VEAGERFPLSDQELLDFNAALLLDYDDEKAHANLEKYGDAFRYQLVMALHLDAWAARLLEDEGALAREGLSPGETRAWVTALQELAALIRQGAYVPGGSNFDPVVRREFG
jgi:hypothetical protein